MKLNKYIDHTNLKSSATYNDILKLCNEAKRYEFYSICVNPCMVKFAYDNLKNTNIKIASAVGFPLGQNTTKIKCEEAHCAVLDGASEIDMVINITELKNKNYDYVLNEIDSVYDASLVPLKVIIETSQLTKTEIIKMCKIINQSKATFIKTSTGFIGAGANLEDVKLMAKHIKNGKLIKASGGIKTYDSAIDFINAGASRLGCSAGVSIMESLKNKIV